ALIWGRRGTGTGIPARRRWKDTALLRLTSWLSPTVPLIIANAAGAFGAGDWMHSRRRGRQLVINNGFDVDIFKPDAEARHRLRSAWGVGEEKLIGVAARLAPSKGHGVLFEAVALLAGRHPEVRFVVIGDGPDKRRLENLGRDLGVADRIIWAGAREDMSSV